MRVKAAVVRAHATRLVLEDIDLLEPASGEILVRLVASGVAPSDLDAIAGRLPFPLPFVPGAEGAGIVERVADDVSDLVSGDTVLIVATPFDARDPTGKRADGSPPFASGDTPVYGCFFGQSSFATHLVCDARYAIKLPPDAPLELMAALAGEALRAASAVTGMARDEMLVVTGCDFIGLVAILAAKAHGVGMIIVADPAEARRTLATDVGAHVAVHADDDLSSVVKSMAAGGARVAIDTTGQPTAVQACRDCLGPEGRFIHLNGAASTAPDLAPNAAKILVADLAAHYAAGRLPIEKLVTFFPFELVDDALAALAGGDVVKPVIRFSLGSFGDLDRARTEGAATDVPGDPGPETSVPADAPLSQDPDQDREVPVPV